ncbi:hypothetical protein VaNZ11_007617, partial [Volvox africanus]
GGVWTRHNAVATALTNVALPVLRLHGKAGVAAAATAVGGGGLDGGSGSETLVYDHPLLPLLASLELEAKGILALTLPPPQRHTRPPSPPRGPFLEAAAKSTAAADVPTSKTGDAPFPVENWVTANPGDAATAITVTTATIAAVVSPSLLPVELFLALLGTGYVRGRLPYALADVVIDMLDERSYSLGLGNDGLTSSPTATHGSLKPTHGVHMDAGGQVDDSSCMGLPPRWQPHGSGSQPDDNTQNVGRLTAGSIEALLLAAPAIALIDHGAIGNRRDAAASHGSSTQGYRLLTELAKMLVKRGATIVRQQDILAPPSAGAVAEAATVGMAAAAAAAGVDVYECDADTYSPHIRSTSNGFGSSSSSSGSGGGGVFSVSRLALCCLLHALSRRHRDGVFLPYSTWLYGKVYGQLVAEARAEAQMQKASGTLNATPDGRAAVAVNFGSASNSSVTAAAVPSADADGTEVLTAVELLRLAACGYNRGDKALASLATQRLGTLLRLIAASGDAHRCGRVVAALDDVAWEEEALFGMSTAASPPPPQPAQRDERAVPGLLPVRKARRHVNGAAATTATTAAALAATSTNVWSVLYRIGCAPAKDVVSVLVGGGSGGNSLEEVVSELVYLAARELPCPRLAAVLSWASTGTTAAAAAAAASKLVADDVKGTAAADATAAASDDSLTHGSSRHRLAAVWHMVIDRWLAPGGAWIEGRRDSSVNGAVPCVVPPVVDYSFTGKARYAEAVTSDAEMKRNLVPGRESMDARAAAALLASGERLGCTDPRAAQALSQVVEAVLLRAANCAEANGDEALL